MRIARFAVNDEVGYGIVDGVTAILWLSTATGNGAEDQTAELTIAEIAGHPFGPDEVKLTGCPLSAGGRTAARPGAAEQDCRHRQELPRACSGDRLRGASRATDLPEAVHGRDRSRRRDRQAGSAIPAGRLRGGARHRFRQAVPGRPCGQGAGGDLRLYLRERRHRSRSPVPRRPVGQGEGLRHVLPARPVDRDGPGSFGRAADHDREWRGEAELANLAADPRHRHAGQLCDRGDDDAARRRAADRHARGHRPDRGRRRRDGV